MGPIGLRPEVLSAVEAIKRRIAAEAGITVEELVSKSREWRFVAPRRRFVREIRPLGFSLPEIGRLLGGRHHTTVLHLLRNDGPKPRVRLQALLFHPG